MNSSLMERLSCPVCRGTLESGSLRCDSCGLTFPQAQNVPCLFGPGKEDVWANNQSGLDRLFAENPQIAAALEQADNASLNGADLSAKAGLYQAQGRLREAAELFQAAWRKCYPAEYIRTFEDHLDFIAGQLADCPGPVVDIASGRGTLVSQLLDKTSVPVAATDLSPSVLSGYQAARWPEQVESGRLTLLAFDATAVPFQDRSLPAVTTCLGLQNIPGPERAVRELRRACSGTLYALCMFFPEDDRENQDAAARFGLEGAFSRERLTGLMERCGWKVTCFETPSFPMGPTPVGKVVAGMVFDGLPVCETQAQFITLICE